MNFRSTEYKTDENNNDNSNNPIDYDNNQTDKEKKTLFLRPSFNKKANGRLFFKKRLS